MQQGKYQLTALMCLLLLAITTTVMADDWRTIQSNTTENLNSVYFYGDKGIAVGDNGALLYTNDGGETWEVYYTNTDANLNDVAPYTKENGSRGVIVAGDNGTVLLVDNGDNNGTIERRKSLGSGVNLKAAAATKLSGPGNDNLVVAGDNASVWLSGDKGKNWVEIDIPEQTNNFNSIWFINDRVGYICGSDGSMFKTASGGVSWDKVEGIGNNTNLNKVSFTDENFGWVCGDNGTIATTSDGGDSWQVQTSGTTEKLNDINFIDKDKGACVGENGTILRTNDGGKEWNKDILDGGVAPEPVIKSIKGVFGMHDGTWRAVANQGTVLSNAPRPDAEIDVSETSVTLTRKENSKTPPHSRVFVNTFPKEVPWNTQTDKDWLITIPESGTGDGFFDIYVDTEKLPDDIESKIVDYGNVKVDPDTGFPYDANRPEINVTYKHENNQMPTGGIDFPKDNVTVPANFLMAGWLCDNGSIKKVRVEVRTDSGFIEFGEVKMKRGSRPDVVELYPDLDKDSIMEWMHFFSSAAVTSDFSGSAKLVLKVEQINGDVIVIDEKDFEINKNSPKPFGNIDKPAPGGTVWGGSYPISGWALTPPPGTIYDMGGSMQIYIDGQQAGWVLPNVPRPDIASLYPDHKDAQGAGGVYNFDTSDYPNGVHHIYWQVTDNQGNKNDIGSRYFTIQNTSGGSPEPSVRSIKANAPASGQLLKAVAGQGKDGIRAVTPYNRYFQIMNKGQGNMAWQVSTDEDWLTLEPTSGTGPGWVQAMIDPNTAPAAKNEGLITITESNGASPPEYVTVELDVINISEPPFGSFDYPAQDMTVSGNVDLLGWALDDIGVRSVNIYQNNGDDKELLGSAGFIEGNRIDVELQYSGYPLLERAGWKYSIQTNTYENGSYTFSAEVTDYEGKVVWLEGQTFTIDNSEAVIPFGAVESPKEGAVISGTEAEIAGWVLAAPPNSLATDGSSIFIELNGQELGSPIYSIASPDIAETYPDHLNSENARFSFFLDTTLYPDGDYTLNLLAIDDMGNSNFTISPRNFKIINTVITKIEDEAAVPEKTELMNAYPNPFNPTTQIEYRLSDNTNVTVHIYDILGRHVKTLVDNQFQQAGKYNIRFTTNGLASGVYFCRFTTNNEVFVKKLMLMK